MERRSREARFFGREGQAGSETMHIRDFPHVFSPVGGLTEERALQKYQVVIASRPRASIVALPKEPPVFLLPSTLALDLLQLLGFGEGRQWGRDGGRVCDVYRRTVGVTGEEAGSVGEGGREGVLEGREAGQTTAEVVWAHKSFLRRRCPYFQAMLSSGMREASEPIISLGDVSPPVLRALLLYLYTDTLQVTAEIQTVLLPLLLLAHRYGLHPLMQMCSAYVRRALTDRAPCADVLEWSDVFHLVDIKRMCMSVQVMRGWNEGGGKEGSCEGEKEEGLSERLKRQLHEFKRGLSWEKGEEGNGEGAEEEEEDIGVEEMEEVLEEEEEEEEG